MISMDKKYKTRDGRDVRILCVDGPSDECPVIGIVLGAGGVAYWGVDGRKVAGVFPGAREDNDLVEVKPKYVRWVNVYRHEFSDGIYFGDAFENKEICDSCASDNHKRIACIRIEFEEGEGL